MAKKDTKESPKTIVPAEKAPVKKTSSVAPVLSKVTESTAPAVTISLPAAPVEQSTNSGAAVTKALEIIAEQSGVPVAELKDDTLFTDLGIDSLLSLMITSQFAEDLGTNADPNFFEEHVSVADVKKFFGETTPSSAPGAEVVETTVVQSKVTALPMATVPEVSPSMDSSSDSDSGDAPGDDRFDEVLQIISDETMVPLEELTEDASIADLGIDSLLSLMIGSRLRDELDIEFETQNMSELLTLRSLREAMFLDSLSSSSSVTDSSEGSSAVMVAPGLTTPPSDLEDQDPVDECVPPTTSVVLQGNSKKASNILWIFPDGSGLASSYVNMPRIRDDLVVYGMNSPYLKKGIEMNCSWDAMVKSYIAEIRRRQPSGPYSFAGWSAGGILAFRASQMLMNGGDVVRDLIILDSPPPFNLTLLPEHFFEYCSTAGLLGGTNGAPDWLIAHFRSINKVLSSYSAKPLNKSTLRKVNILWACESSVDDSFYGKTDDPKDMKFLTVKRTDYSAGGWGPLFKGVPVEVELAKGQHHWSLLVSWHPRACMFYFLC